MMTRILAAIALAMAPAIVMAQVYKWIDEKGVTHYGERPAGKNAQPLRDSTAGSQEAPAEEPTPRGRRRTGETELQRQEREFQERHRERQREEQQARDAQARRAPDGSGCRRANSDLATIRRNPTNYSYADEAHARDDVARNCR